MEKLVIDKTKCIGCGFCCYNAAPNNFTFGDTTAEVKDETVTEEAKAAIDGCPVGAISIEEVKEETEEKAA